LRAEKNFPAFDLRQSGSVAVAACAVVVSYHLQFVFALWRRSVALALPLPPDLSHETRTCTVLKFCYAYHTHDTLCASPSGLSLPKTAKQTNPQHFAWFPSAVQPLNLKRRTRSGQTNQPYEKNPAPVKTLIAGDFCRSHFISFARWRTIGVERYERRECQHELEHCGQLVAQRRPQRFLKRSFY
jgi:hypothetical protein